MAATQLDQAEDTCLVVFERMGKDRLVVRDPVAEVAQLFHVGVQHRPRSCDRHRIWDERKNRMYVRVPDVLILAGREHVAPERELKFRDYLTR